MIGRFNETEKHTNTSNCVTLINMFLKVNIWLTTLTSNGAKARDEILAQLPYNVLIGATEEGGHDFCKFVKQLVCSLSIGKTTLLFSCSRFLCQEIFVIFLITKSQELLDVYFW